MTVGRTSDARFFVDSGAAIIAMPNVLGATIAGEGSISRQPYLGETYEQATIHSAGGGVNFSTIYQNAAFEAVAALAASNPNTPTEFAVICQPVPTNWHIIPVSWPRASYDAPPADVITRPWQLDRRAAGWYGLRVDDFSISATGVIGNDLDAGMAFVAVTAIATRTRLATSGNNITGHYDSGADGARTGIFGPLTVSGADRDLTLTLTGGAGNVTGYVLSLGALEEVPDG